LPHISAERSAGRDDVAHRLLEVGLKIAVPYDAFVRVQVDEDEGPVAEQAHLRHDGALQWHDDRARSHAFQREAG